MNLTTLTKTAVLAAVILPLSAFASSGKTDVNAAARLAKLLGGIKSMSANFEQTTKGSKTTTYSGSMSVERPNKFRWDIKTPSEQLTVASGNTLWQYDKGLMQAIHQSVGDQVGETPALLLSSNPTQIAQNFSVSQPVAGKNYYVLAPKSGTHFKSLSLSFNGGKPVMMVLNDNYGQTSIIRFSNISINTKIPASQFTFTPPKGVDVIKQ